MEYFDNNNNNNNNYYVLIGPLYAKRDVITTLVHEVQFRYGSLNRFCSLWQNIVQKQNFPFTF